MPVKSLGMTIPALLFFALLCWAALLYSLSGWVGRNLPHAQGTDRMMLQLVTGGIAVFLWILLAGVILVMGVKGIMPEGVGVAAWAVHLLSCVAAVFAIAVMYEPEVRWPAAVVAAPPVLVAAFALYSCFPAAQWIPPRTAGFAVWAAILAISLSVTPEVLRWRAAHADDSIDATPGPKLDAWMARQRERRRQQELEELSKVDDETTVMELAGLTVPDGPARQEALAVIRRIPNRQAECVNQLRNGAAGTIMRLLPEIDVQPTPELCQVARDHLRKELILHQKMFDTPQEFRYPMLTEALPGMVWLTQNCPGCRADVDAIAAFARTQIDSPERQKFLAALDATRKE
jgi:hypothetical protein